MNERDTRKLNDFLQGRDKTHEPVKRYFSLFQGQRQNYSAMKPCHAAIDCLMKDGTLVGQLTLDGEIEIYRADTKLKEPIEIEV